MNKIYPHQNLNIINILNKLSFDKKEYYTLLYSNNNVHKIVNKNIYRLSINIKNNEILKIKDNEYFLENTEYNYLKINSQLPTDYNQVNIKKEIYVHPIIKDYNFNILYENDKIVEYYFDIAKNKFNKNKFEDYIISLIS